MVRLKKNTFVLILFLIVGLITGSILGDILDKWIPFLTNSKSIVWEPKADLAIIKYNFHVELNLSLASIIGLIGAFLLYRKM